MNEEESKDCLECKLYEECKSMNIQGMDKKHNCTDFE